MSKKPWLFDPDHLQELEDRSDRASMADDGWSDWKPYSGADEGLFEMPSQPRRPGYRRSREDVLRRHHRARREQSHRER